MPSSRPSPDDRTAATSPAAPPIPEPPVAHGATFRLPDARAHEALFELVGDAIFLFTADGRVTRANGAACRMWGCSSERFLAMTTEALLDPECLRDDPLRYGRLTPGQVLRTERVGRRCDGGTFPVEITTVRLDDGTFQGIVRDLSERRRAEEERASFRAVQEASLDGFVLLRPIRDDAGAIRDFEFTYVNPAAEPILRRSRDAIVGKRLTEEMPATRDTGQYDAFVRVVETGDPDVRDISYVAQGWDHTFHTVAVRVGDGVALSFSDVTARFAAEQQLRRSEARFRQVMDRAADLVAIIDAAGQLTYASPSYERGLGYAPETLLGKTAFDLVHPDDVGRVVTTFHQLVGERDATVSLEFRARHADGWWRTFAVAARNLLHEPSVEGIVLSGHDVTEERQLEVRLRQAQKMEAVGQLAGGIAHDFNNLLTVIKANTEFLAEELTGHAREDLEEIRKAATRAAALTRQLLAFSRQQVLAPRIVDPNVVIGDLERMLARLIGEDIEVLLGLDREVGRILVDQGQLEQILMNLAVNARDAMPSGGVLRVTTARGPLPDALRAARPELSARAWVRIAVQDTGMGMSPEVVARVFDPFFTTKALGKGTGLGLATVYGIVEQSGGVIDVQSAPGMGASFSLYFPACDDQPDLPDDDAGVPLAARRSETVLLVEDDDAVRAVALRMLAASGFEVIVARNGAEALLRLSQVDTRVDVVVSDAVMPQLGGVELLRAAESLRPGLASVLMSGYTDDELVRRGGLDERVILLSKPFTREHLVAAIDQALAERRKG